MAGSIRYRFTASPRSSSTALPIHDGSRSSDPRVSGSVRHSVATSPLYLVRRVALDTASPERRQLRAVADISDRPSVGERLAAHPFLALLSRCRLSDLRRRKELGVVDDSQPLRSVK